MDNETIILVQAVILVLSSKVLWATICRYTLTQHINYDIEYFVYMYNSVKNNYLVDYWVQQIYFSERTLIFNVLSYTSEVDRSKRKWSTSKSFYLSPFVKTSLNTFVKLMIRIFILESWKAQSYTGSTDLLHKHL